MAGEGGWREEFRERRSGRRRRGRRGSGDPVAYPSEPSPRQRAAARGSGCSWGMRSAGHNFPAAGTGRVQVAAGTGLGAGRARTAGPRVPACGTEEKAENGGGGSDGARERRGDLLTERGEPVSERDLEPRAARRRAEPSRERRAARGSIGARRGGGAGPESSRCHGHAAHRASGRVRAAMCSVRGAHKQACATQVRSYDLICI